MTWLVSGKELAEILGITPGRVTQLKKDGIIGHSDRQKYDLSDSVKAYIEYKVSTDGSTAADELRKARADADLQESKALEHQMKVAELEGRTHLSEDVEEVMTDMVYNFKGAALALPGRCAMDCEGKTAMEIEKILRRRVALMLEELAKYQYDPAVFAQRVKERTKWIKSEVREAGGDDE